MTIVEAFLLSLSLCVDSLVVSTTTAFHSKISFRRGALMAAVFGLCQGAFPLAGALIGDVARAFIEAVKAGTQTPIDVYDTLTMMAIAPLSAASIARGGAPVDFPDFTQGKYLRRELPLATKYSLDLIVEDPDTPIVP